MTVPSLFHRFLVICFISGASALECISSTLIQRNYPLNETQFQIYSETKKINCSMDENACEEVQLILKIDRNALLVTHRGCATKDLHGGPESITTGHQHYNIQSNVSYCFHDLCNANFTEEIILVNPDDYKASGANDSAQCYSGLSFDSSEAIQDSVRCSEGYNQCSSGIISVTDGSISVLTYTKTCQQHPNCTVPQKQSFGSIAIISESSSCCVGSYCNQNKTATRVLDSIEPSRESPDCSDNHFPLNPNSDSDSEDHKAHDAWSTDPQFPVPAFRPFILASRAPSLAFCSLVIVLGCTILGILW
ncbi:uncharacterized protein PHA67_003333 [Liasis olivaceus]